jgi:membrane-bound lytic murein transglycosylase D
VAPAGRGPGTGAAVVVAPPEAEPAPVAVAAAARVGGGPRRASPQARVRLDPLDDASRGDLWARVRQGFAMPDLDNDLVRKWEQYYASGPTTCSA